MEKLASGIAELDTLLGGGIERGTSTLIVGAAGTGKSSLAAQFVAAAAARGQTSALFIFDESIHTLLTRVRGAGDRPAAARGRGARHRAAGGPRRAVAGRVRPRHPPGRRATQGASIVVIDSLNGYLNAMPEERFLIIQLHELLTYLGQAGVATILIGAHQGLIGSQMITPVDASYLADAVILMRYFEAKGEVRQAISVVKKRGGAHERTIREFRLEAGRISVGRAAAGLPRRAHRRADLRGSGRSPARGQDLVTAAGTRKLEQRLLVLAPTGKDAALTAVHPRAGRCRVHLLRGSGRRSATQLEAGAGAVLLPEEAVALDRSSRLVNWLASQPPWSDLPVLVLARPGADSAAVAQAMDLLGNVTVLERPMRVAALVSAVRTALRARQRQYQARAQLARIEQSERDLREAHIRKDEFLAILAHELRNPLAPIRNSLHILRLTNREHDPTVRRAGEMMERQVDHMVRLVDDLLEVSRITRGKIELRMQTGRPGQPCCEVPRKPAGR